MFGDAETVIDRGVTAGRIEPGSTPNLRRRNAGDGFGTLGRVLFLDNEIAPGLEGGSLATLGNEALIRQTFGDDDMGKRVDERDVTAGFQLKMILGLHMGRFDEIDLARIGNDQPRAAVDDAPLHARSENRMRVGRVGADDEDHVRFQHRVEILGAGGFA